MFPFLTWGHGVKSSVRRELAWLKTIASLVNLYWCGHLNLYNTLVVQVLCPVTHIYLSGDPDCNRQTGRKVQILMFMNFHWGIEPGVRVSPTHHGMEAIHGDHLHGIR